MCMGLTDLKEASKAKPCQGRRALSTRTSKLTCQCSGLLPWRRINVGVLWQMLMSCTLSGIGQLNPMFAIPPADVVLKCRLPMLMFCVIFLLLAPAEPQTPVPLSAIV